MNMTQEQLEAQRVRFEQHLENWHKGQPPNEALFAAKAYIAALQTDRAQRAEPAGWQHRVYYTDNNDPGWSKWREVLECDMGNLQKLACEYPARHQMRQVYTAPQQSAQPVAAANGWAKGLEIRMSQGWKLKGGICPVLYSDTVNGYGVGRDDLWLATTDTLKSAQPVEVQRAVPEPTPEMVIAGAAAAREHYEETGGNNPAVIYRAMLAAAPMVDVVPPATSRDRWMYEQGRLAERDPRTHGKPVEVQSLTDATQFEKDVARWMEKDGLTREQAECEVNYRTIRKALKSGLSAHGIKPTSSE